MTDEQRQKIISIIIGAIISVAVGIAGVYGISVLAGCVSAGSAQWDVQVAPLEAENGSI